MRRWALMARRAVCPVVVGRDEELAQLGRALDAAGRGRGAMVVLCGEAGVGKSRLARETVAAASTRSMATLVGRSVPHGLSPYRPLTEALFPASRAGKLPDAAELRPFRHALGRVLPEWRTAGPGVEEPAVVVAEGVLRLLRLLGGGQGALLLVEDAHWADDETLSALEYLGDSVASEPVVVLVTVRSGSPSAALDLMERLEMRGAAHVLALGRLSPSEMLEMAAACTGEGSLADGVVEAVVTRSDGLPLLIEELLSVPLAGISEVVPDSFADAVARRLRSLPAESVIVVQSAAILGRRFDWRLLPGVTGLDETHVRRGLETATEVQLLATEPDGTFRFHHALTRDAVLTGLLPPTRVALARRGAHAIDDGGDDDDLAALAADLWVAAEDVDTAARLLLAAGRRALARGALAAAERLLERATALPIKTPTLRAEVAEALADALALAAKLDRARQVGAEALRWLDASGASASRRARLHLALARAADAATRWELAREHLDVAGRLAREEGDDALLAAVHALTAHVAMGDLRFGEAEELAARAAEAADHLDLPEVACEALEVLGRRERLRDLRRAASYFERAYAVARDHGLVVWSIRALHELGTIDMFETLSGERLRQASELAYHAGALSVAATVDLQLTGLHAFLFELDEALEAGARAVDVARTLGLSEVHAAALLQLGFIHAIAGRRPEMEDAVDEALRLAGDHPEARALAWGHARATFSLYAEDRAGAMEQLDVAMTWARQVPGASGAYPVLWALVRVVGGSGEEVIAEVEGLEAPAIPMNAAVLAMARAAVAGRAGRRDDAEAGFARADAVLRAQRIDGLGHLVRRILAEAALADGWGDPVSWLTEATAFFDASGHHRVAAACRDLLRRVGRRVPRSPAPGVPERLRRAGVTSREAEVLRLVGERLSNREIAERLYLSPRTVEKHVERLLGKTMAPTRVDLGRIAREALAPAAPPPTTPRT